MFLFLISFLSTAFLYSLDGVIVYDTRELRELFSIVGEVAIGDNFNSLRPSDAYMRQLTNHHWFR